MVDKVESATSRAISIETRELSSSILYRTIESDVSSWPIPAPKGSASYSSDAGQLRLRLSAWASLNQSRRPSGDCQKFPTTIAKNPR
jgi:hypothetical protein